MEPATETARRWLSDLRTGPGLNAWRLFDEPVRGTLIDAWARWAAANGGPLIAQLVASTDLRPALVEHPERVEPAPELWMSLRDFVRGAHRDLVPMLWEGVWGFVGDPRPVSVDKVAVIYARLPDDGRRNVVVNAVAIELVLTNAGWRVAGFSEPARHPPPVRASAMSRR